MKRLLLLLFIGFSLTLMAQGIKLNYKGAVMPFDVKIEKIIPWEWSGSTGVFCKIKQKENFSFQINFEGCNIITPDGETHYGKLIKWRGKNQMGQLQHVGGEDYEEFLLVFPTTKLVDYDEFDITVGFIKNQQKTPLTFKNVKIIKK